jgi:hypothetical protein
MAESAQLADFERDRKRIAEISNYVQNITRAIQMIDKPCSSEVEELVEGIFLRKLHYTFKMQPCHAFLTLF